MTSILSGPFLIGPTCVEITGSLKHTGESQHTGLAKLDTVAIASASPITSIAVEDEVGARFIGQASRSTEVSSVTSLCSARVESALPVSAIRPTSKRLMCGSRSSSSGVSPE